jgi:hypothetical protein
LDACSRFISLGRSALSGLNSQPSAISFCNGREPLLLITYLNCFVLAAPSTFSTFAFLLPTFFSFTRNFAA